MKILITGASGFFGKSLISALEKMPDNFKCTGVYQCNPLQFADARFASIKCDLLNIETMIKLIEDVQPTHLVHLAWYVAPQRFWIAKENIDWLYASIKLFHKFCEYNGQVFLGAGTIAEYDWSSGILDEHATSVKPNTLYGQSKKSLHDVILSIKKTYNYKTKIIWPRIGYFFGKDEPKQKLISRLIHGINNSEPLKLVGKNTEFSYAHVKYLGNILAKLILSCKDDCIFNLSASNTYSLEKIVNFIGSVCGKSTANVIYNACKNPVSEPLNFSIDTKKMDEIVSEQIPNTFFDDLIDMIYE